MPRHVDVLIVGSGFAGIGMGIQLKRAGRSDFLILEKESDLGGTWRDNTYPGCACDVPSYLYSFSFAQNPRWTRMFSPQQEIWDYLRDCVTRYGLAEHLRFDALVTAATYDETTSQWRVSLADGDSLTCRALVTGVGALHLPKPPDVRGLDSFAGAVFHSSQWRHDVDLRGKRVAVVGTGASAVQLVPQIADEVAHLDVYQRTPAWILPKPDRVISDTEQRLYRRHPLAQRAVRSAVYWGLELRGMGLTVSPRFLPMVKKVAERHLQRRVPDPELRRQLTPDYEIGCKRMLISSDFYPALQKPNVSLVPRAVAAFTATDLRDAEGVERPADVVILATGFDLQANLEQIAIRGRDGTTLSEVWAEQGLNAHLGIMVSGFPNLFMLLGPNTGLGHNSVVFMIEAQIGFVLRALATLDGARRSSIDVRSVAQRRSVRAVQGHLAGSVWQSGCRSWYLNESGRNFAIWPWTTMRYWWTVRRLKRRDYMLGS